MTRSQQKRLTRRWLCAVALAASLAGGWSPVASSAGTALGWIYGTPPAPALELKTLAGTAFDLKSLKGKVVLVNFWGTWCPPCRAEMPAIQALKSRFASQPFEVVAVHMGDGVSDIAPFLAEMNPPLDLIIVLDETNATSQPWGIRGLPATWLLDHNGNRVYEAVGEREWNDDSIAAIVDKMLVATQNGN